MRCDGCIHFEKDKCIVHGCVYRHIPEGELHDKGIHIKGPVWEYEGKHYKIIDFEVYTNSYICVESKG